MPEGWCDTFATQTRLYGTPGPAIGEALAEIDAHCADSGQSPAEAFGDPVDYAAALARGLRPASSRRGHAWRGGLRAAATHAPLEAGHARGKLVITVTDAG
jgi:hypothetical protein